MRSFRSRMRGGDSKAGKASGDTSGAQQDSQNTQPEAGKLSTAPSNGKEDERHHVGKEEFGSMAGGRRTHRRRSHRRRSHRRRSHRRRSHRRHGGMGNARRTLAKAIVPFGLWGAQRLMRRKKNRRTMKRMGKRVTSLL